mmetsp:Transcript_33840/g.89713  ORF Transcript_33840/g.89713 Transcript_33840/m.89713 type:complete len:451 (+) Transcript_33840:93-1445(+)
MDEIMVGWIFLLAMLLWRGLTSFLCVQKLFHCFGPLAVLFQWWALTAAGLGLLLIRTFYDICLYDYFAYHFLMAERVEENLRDILADNKNVTEVDIEALKIPPGLKVFSLIAPLFGIVGFVMVVTHVGRMLRKMREVMATSSDPDHAYRWFVPERLSMVLMVVGMPMVFIVLSMRALIRVWAVMTGSAWVPYHRNLPAAMSWNDVATVEIATYSMDLELAVTFQFYMVFCFGQLCGSFLANSRYVNHSAMSPEVAKQYRRTLNWAAIQGLYAFVLVGVLRSALDFAICFMQEHPEHKALADQIEITALSKIGPVFAFATVMCVANMLIVGKMKDITDHLGNANMKFQGTRLLLLIAQIQPQVLSAITVGSHLYQVLQANAEKYHLDGWLEAWTFTDYQAKLLHASLLNMECLIVIVFNRVFWTLDDAQMGALLTRGAPVSDPGAGYVQLA